MKLNYVLGLSIYLPGKKNRNWIGKENSIFFPPEKWQGEGWGMFVLPWTFTKVSFLWVNWSWTHCWRKGEFVCSVNCPIFPSALPELLRWAFSLKAQLRIKIGCLNKQNPSLMNNFLKNIPKTRSPYFPRCNKYNKCENTASMLWGETQSQL